MMTREQYLQYRVTNDIYRILFYYFVEKSATLMPFELFAFAMEKYCVGLQQKFLEKNNVVITTTQILDSMFNMVIRHFDIKFQIVYLEIKREEKVDKIINIIM